MIRGSAATVCDSVAARVVEQDDRARPGARRRRALDDRVHARAAGSRSCRPSTAPSACGSGAAGAASSRSTARRAGGTGAGTARRSARPRAPVRAAGSLLGRRDSLRHRRVDLACGRRSRRRRRRSLAVDARRSSARATPTSKNVAGTSLALQDRRGLRVYGPGPSSNVSAISRCWAPAIRTNGV